MIKDFMTAYWGYLPTTKIPYPAATKVNAFVGRSGHGKTTIWDGLRMVLGDTTFENNRNIGHYVHEKSNWAIVRVGFINEPITGIRPFERYGFTADEVVVCCRAFKDSNGRWHKEYYVFDGNFTNLIELAQNPKAYKLRLKAPEQYKQILEDCMGITPAFRRLMAMNPESVRNMISLTANQLFKKIFELKGIKDIQDRYRTAKASLDEQKIQCIAVQKELDAARGRFEELKKEAELYQKYHCNVQSKADVDQKATKLLYYSIGKEIDDDKCKINETEEEIKQLQDKVNCCNAQINFLNEEILKIDQQISICERNYQDADTKLSGMAKPIAQSELQIEVLKERIKKTSKIDVLNISDVEKSLQQAKEIERQADARLVQIQTEILSLDKKISALNLDKAIFPDFVEKYRSRLSNENIPFIMLADAVSVKVEYKKWQKAVEAYLGLERFRIIVAQETYLKAKEIQQEVKYHARVCLPKSGRCSVQYTVDHPTILSVLQVNHEGEIGGYLKHLESVFLVDTVSEGHALQAKGLISITAEGLVQDCDGAIFRHYRSLCCGKEAFRQEREQLAGDLISIREQAKYQTEKVSSLHGETESWANKLSQQQELLQLPEDKNRLLEGELELNNLKKIETLYRETRDSAKGDKEKQLEIKSEHNGNLQESKAEFLNASKTITRETRNLSILRENLVSKLSTYETLKESLINLGLTQDDLEFIPQDIRSIGFMDDSGQPYSVPDFKAISDTLARAISDFRTKYPTVDEKTVTLVKAQEGQVENCERRLQMVQNMRDECDIECQNCLYALKEHVKESINGYVDQFANLATLLGAQAKGRFEQPTEDPEFWELHMFIGFDGKEPIPIDAPEQSQGQRACTSLMLLLAAISSRRGHIVPVMFLDEPKSRLDDDRGNEVGKLLQVTNVQYFITHQHGESLKTIDWINHAFTCSLKQKDKRFAEPMILKQMRID